MAQLWRRWANIGLLFKAVLAIEIDLGDPVSIKSAAGTVAYGMMSYYNGNVSGYTPGLLPSPYYWWEAGAMFGALIDYWQLTGDDTYNSVVSQALQFQVGPHDDFMPNNQSFDMGNDDQAFWAMSAMSATESNFQNPSIDQPSWLSLVQAVFNEQIGRWDTTTCGGGLRWQVFPANSGYDLKNSISNGGLINIAARLARYTQDDMYAQWVEKIWEWMERIGLIDENYNVYDNAEADRLNCTQIDKNQWTYNAGTMLMGASYMYNYTNGDPLWYNRTQGLMKSIAFDYFPADDGGIMKDICEEHNVCNTDQKSFKAYLSRWMAAATEMAPFTYDTFYPLLTVSAQAAAAQCSGDGPVGPAGQTCGLKWYLNGTWDGTSGVGQQMAALQVILASLYKQVPGDDSSATPAPLTNATGGTSISNPNAGYNASAALESAIISPATTADKGGAWFVTALILILGAWTTWFMWSQAWESEEISPAAATSLSEKEKERENHVEKVASVKVLSHNFEDEEKGFIQTPGNCSFKDIQRVSSHNERQRMQLD